MGGALPLADCVPPPPPPPLLLTVALTEAVAAAPLGVPPPEAVPCSALLAVGWGW